MAASIVQYKTGQGSGATLGVTFDAATTSGNTIVVFCTQGDNGTSINWSAADNKGNSINALGDKVTQGTRSVSRMFYAYNITGGSSHTVTVTRTAGSETYAVGIVEIGGVTTSDPKDKYVTGAGASGSPSTSSTGTLTQANQIAIYCIGTRLSQVETQDPTTAGFDLFATQTTSGEWGALSLLSKITSATTAIAGDGAISYVDWTATMATFMEAAGTTGNPMYYYAQMAQKIKDKWRNLIKIPGFDQIMAFQRSLKGAR